MLRLPEPCVEKASSETSVEDQRLANEHSKEARRGQKVTKKEACHAVLSPYPQP